MELKDIKHAKEESGRLEKRYSEIKKIVDNAAEKHTLRHCQEDIKEIHRLYESNAKKVAAFKESQAAKDFQDSIQEDADKLDELREKLKEGQNKFLKDTPYLNTLVEESKVNKVKWNGIITDITTTLDRLVNEGE